MQYIKELLKKRYNSLFLRLDRGSAILYLLYNAIIMGLLSK